MMDHTGSKKKAYIVSESQLQDTRLNIFDKQGRRRSSRFQRDGTGTMGEVWPETQYSVKAFVHGSAMACRYCHNNILNNFEFLISCKARKKARAEKLNMNNFLYKYFLLHLRPLLFSFLCKTSRCTVHL